jgi:hypothetical protein
MIKNFYKTIFSMLTLMSLSFVVFRTVAIATTIYVEPQLNIKGEGEDFSVNIVIADVADLCGWEFKLYYSNSFLNGTDITEGSFLKTGGTTFFYVVSFTDTYNATHGLVRAACTLLTPTGVNGDGDLAKIKFKTKGAGETALRLADTILVDSATSPNAIPHMVSDGLVRVSGSGDVFLYLFLGWLFIILFFLFAGTSET